MNMISDQVRQTIASQLKVLKADLPEQARFVEDLKATSLDVVEMIMALEGAFEVEISDNDAEKMLTVGDVIAFMRVRLG